MIFRRTKGFALPTVLIASVIMMMILFVAVVITLAKKFASSNPNVADAAKKAAANKAIQLIGRFFK